MLIFHIRRKLKKQRGNQFYKDRSDRGRGTFCGSAETDHDIMWNGKAEVFGEWIPCEECKAKADSFKDWWKNKRRK